ncbi:MAG: adenylate kinase [Epsilonproteobacteria bacterium]|nr:adenylate kinase [Campylobacterota bacterium]
MKSLFLIIGAPGSGKTTDADMIAKNNPQKIAHYSTGEMLRDEVKSGSELGKIIDKRISQGHLVPVEIAVETIMKAINNTSKKIILVDGFPRSIEQMMELEKKLLSNKEVILKLVLEVIVSDATAKKRVLGRNRGIDDKEEVFTNRMKIYKEPMDLIQNFYNSKNLLVKIDGEREIDEIVSDMEKIINQNEN